MEINEIKMFNKEYAFLSNFYPAIIQFEGLNYATVEHAFVAAKTTEFFFRKLIVSLPAEKAGLAKKRGRTIKLRKGWDDMKIDIMHELLCYKFKQPSFKKMLLETGDAKLIEGNFWHDNIWGNCMCPKCKDIEGQNWLGRLLTDVRDQVEQKGHCYRGHS
jgi:ribA/ribD-fused uncharacterized protein